MQSVIFQIHYFLSAAEDQPPRSSCLRRGKVDVSLLSHLELLDQFVQHVRNRPKSWTVGKHSHACHWRGITCDSNRQVVRLLWDNLELRGNLTFGLLPVTLRSLRVSENGCAGSVAEHNWPPNLELVKMGRNQFSGDVPWELFPKGTEHIDFHNNRFEGPLQAEKLPQTLVTLNVAYNKFQGHLDLTSLPRSLRILDLENNQFTGKIALHTLPNGMRRLFLNGNHLEGSVAIGVLPKGMQQISLASNSFKGELRLEVEEAQLPRGLFFIDISHNSFVLLPEWLPSIFILSESQKRIRDGLANAR